MHAQNLFSSKERKKRNTTKRYLKEVQLEKVSCSMKGKGSAHYFVVCNLFRW